tara:strand:- start:1103 stop:1357 length:255 start_codon:yes stop_codon:yes gene_type:complete
MTNKTGEETAAYENNSLLMRMYASVVEEIKIMSKEDDSYKDVVADKKNMSAMDLMRIYEKLLKDNAALKERVIRLETRLAEVSD